MSEKQNDAPSTGHGALWTELFLKMEMHAHTLLICVSIFIVSSIILTFIFEPKLSTLLSKYLYKTITSLGIPKTKIILKLATEIFNRMFFILFIPFMACLFLYGFLYDRYKKRGEKFSEEKWIAGSKLITVDECNKQIAAHPTYNKTRLQIGGINIPVELEQRHWSLWGMQGSGKSNMGNQSLEQIRNIKNSKAIVYCFKPDDYFAKFYDPDRGDILFNPLDVRGLSWNIFREIETSMDIDTIADSLIPDENAHNSNDAFWCTAARKVFVGILSSLFEKGHQYQNNTEIWKSVVNSVSDILKQIKTTQGGKAGSIFLQEPKTNMALSVHAVLMQYILCFQYMKDGPTKFSINDWLTNDRGGWIFITNYSDIKDTLRPILSLFVDLLVKKLLALREPAEKKRQNADRKFYFFLDEFNSLQKLTSIQDLITKGRSFGASVWIGNQDVASIESIYGKEGATSIIDNLGNTMIFAGEGEEYCNRMASRIGKTRIKKWNRTLVNRIGEGDASTWQQVEEEKYLVQPAGIARLQDLEGYIKLRNFDWANIKFDYKIYHDHVEPFQIRDDLYLSEIKKSQRMARELGTWAYTMDAIKEEVDAESPFKYISTMEEQIKELLNL